jgi:hypothetical protein
LDLADDAVGREEPKPAADAGTEAAEFGGRGTAGAGVERVARVAVAEAGGGELATGDGLDEGEVIGIALAEGSDAPNGVDDRMKDGAEESGARVSLTAARASRYASFER